MNKFVKISATVFSVMCIVVILCYAYLTNSYAQKIEKSQIEIAEETEVNLKEYLDQYIEPTSQKVDSLSQSVESLSEEDDKLVLSQEQRDSIVDTVLENLSTELIEQITSSDEVVSKEVLEKLETDIFDQIKTAVSANVSLGDDELTKIAESVLVILESDILKNLTESGYIDEEDLQNIENAIKEKIEKIENTLTSYSTQITAITQNIKQMEASGYNNTDLEDMRQNLSDQINKLSVFTNEKAAVLSIVESNLLDTSADVETVSSDITDIRKVITECDAKITNVEQSMSEELETVNSNISTLESNLETTTENINESLKTTTDSISQSLQDTKDDINESLTETKDDINASIIETKETFTGALEEKADKKDLDTATENMKVTTDSISQSLEEAKDTLTGSLEKKADKKDFENVMKAEVTTDENGKTTISIKFD